VFGSLSAHPGDLRLLEFPETVFDFLRLWHESSCMECATGFGLSH